MSTIFTPPWTTGNGVGMGTAPTLDLTVHGYRMGKLQSRLRAQMGQLMDAHGFPQFTALLALNYSEISRANSALISELQEN